MASLHLIRFPKAEDRQRALLIFLDVPATRLVMPGHDMLVTDQHVAALERAGIPFEYLSRTNANGTGKTTVQS